MAHCDEFISQFPNGYDTVVGERGIKLSGGQRQRLDRPRDPGQPALLILDEATSSLDSESEQMIQDGLRRLHSGRTTFVIAHRLSDDPQRRPDPGARGGTIVERGSHADLLRPTGATGNASTSGTVRGRSVHQPGEDFTPRPERPAPPRAWERNLMDEAKLLEGVLRGVLGGQKSAAAAPRYLTGPSLPGLGRMGGSLLGNPTVLLTAAGLAWGLIETMTSQGTQGGARHGPPAPRRGLAAAALPVMGTAAGAPAQSDALRLVRLAISAAQADGGMGETERASSAWRPSRGWPTWWRLSWRARRRWRNRCRRHRRGAAGHAVWPGLHARARRRTGERRRAYLSGTARGPARLDPWRHQEDRAAASAQIDQAPEEVLGSLALLRSPQSRRSEPRSRAYKRSTDAMSQQDWFMAIGGHQVGPVTGTMS